MRPVVEALPLAGKSAPFRSKAEKLADYEALEQQQRRKELNGKRSTINNEGVVYSQDPNSQIINRYIKEFVHDGTSIFLDQFMTQLHEARKKIPSDKQSKFS